LLRRHDFPHGILPPGNCWGAVRRCPGSFFRGDSMTWLDYLVGGVSVVTCFGILISVALITIRIRRDSVEALIAMRDQVADLRIMIHKAEALFPELDRAFDKHPYRLVPAEWVDAFEEAYEAQKRTSK
jgi:hypothetical protein